jgi:hypothetical protein
LREVAPGPVVVVIFRQPEVAVLTEADAPVIIELMGDEKAAAGDWVEGIAAAAARDIGVGIAIEAQVARAPAGRR